MISAMIVLIGMFVVAMSIAVAATAVPGIGNAHQAQPGIQL